MMSKVHFWIVCDAVDYIRDHGDSEQKRALQAIQIAYGDKKPIEDIPRGKSAMETLAGFESWQTDKFADLSLSLRALPRGGKDKVSGLGFHMFTAFNHFINPYPELASSWCSAYGYSYSLSSMAGPDVVVVNGISKLLQGVVDIENSIVLERIKPFWTKGTQEWNNNFQRGLSDTEFAPWTALSQVYYSCLVQTHCEALEVRGANQYIAGLQLLGPVVHSIADACSPQHVRSTLGFGHSIWENFVKSRVYSQKLKVDPALVNNMLRKDPFEPRLVVKDGPMKGKFDIETLIYRLSVRTAERLRQSTAQSWKDLWQAGGRFWRHYLTGKAMKEDAKYLYNLAVAGTVHAIVRSCDDLIKENVLTPDQGLVDPKKMPDLDRAQKELPELPVKRTTPDALPPEEVMQVPYTRVEDVLGFEPVGKSDLSGLLSRARTLFAREPKGKPMSRDLSHLLRDIEKAVLDQYLQKADVAGPDFCPMKTQESIPVGSDLSAHWGTATFRMPSDRECEDPGEFEKYIHLNDAHAYMAYKLQATQAIAGLRFERIRIAREGAASSRIDYLAAELERFRDEEVSQFADGFSLDSADRVTSEALAASSGPKKRKESAAKGLLSSIQEKVSSFFQVVPVSALATAAAVALLVIFVIPLGGIPEPTILGLSSEKWAKPKLTLMAPKSLVPRTSEAPAPPPPPKEKTKLAMLVYFKGFKAPMDQETVDLAYKAIKPSATVDRYYDVISPYKVKEAADQGQIKIQTTKEAVEGLRDKLGVTQVLVITVVAKGDKYDVDSELTDIKEGKEIAIKMDRGIVKAELCSTMRDTVLGLLGAE